MPRNKSSDISARIQTVINEYGHGPLGKTPMAGREPVPWPLKASPEVILAMVLDAMIKSRPISHDLSQRTINHLIEVGYHDIDKLHASTWEERTVVLREGGYNRYREQAATNLGNLADFVVKEYDGDLNNLLEAAGGKRDKIEILMKEIKGIGDLTVELFFNNVQAVWPSIAPFVDSRSLKTAGDVGIGSDIEAIYVALQRDPEQMSWFANGLSTIRLEKRQQDIY
ncbi:hypothetical protein N7532_005311 [Penicillium argentinense]|uniref:HhH-GPD domain-containing protein n=1 Tax=Penicillium argentinense TaxID=1131581 RepID=A0A9W9K9V0_9EURO|nr:uncharacterized protein N7532_005311 [Penicillium argentinense]KAJ5098310.1 hypothetical protein N7532_005311 [Penicillium argentinense]